MRCDTYMNGIVPCAMRRILEVKETYMYPVFPPKENYVLTKEPCKCWQSSTIGNLESFSKFKNIVLEF